MPLSDPRIGGALRCRRTQAAVEICDPCHVLPGLPWGLGGMFSLAGGRLSDAPRTEGSPPQVGCCPTVTKSLRPGP